MVILAIISVAFVLLVGIAAFGTAIDNSDASSELFTDISEIFGAGFEITTIIPLLLVVGLLITTLGVLAQR